MDAHTCDRCGQPVVAHARHCSACGRALATRLVGAVLGERYRIVRLLGAGGMGRVYVAEHAVLPKRLAVKVLAPELARDDDMVRLFRREAFAASRLAHPNVASTLDMGTYQCAHEGELSYIVMELVEGRGLDTQIVPGGMPVTRAVNLSAQIASALGAAHEAGIVHRDVKPANVMVVVRGSDDGDELVKVVDFGLALLRGTDGAAIDTDTPHLAAGTPAYVAPETALGRPADARTDVYSLGAVLYELLTGTPPFMDDDPFALLNRHAFESPAPPSSRAPGARIGAEVDALVMQMLAKNPDERPGDGQRAAQLLSRLVGRGTGRLPPIVEHVRAILVVRGDDTHEPTPQLTIDKPTRATVTRLVRDHGGDIARAAGDDLVCCFTSAEIAVRCGSAIRKLTAPPRPTVAIDFGVVEIGAGGGVFGQPVNAALRLVRLAAPGEALVTAAACDRLGRALRATLEARGEVALGGRAAPLQVFAIGSLRRRATEPELPSVDGLYADTGEVHFRCNCGTNGVASVGAPPPQWLRGRCGHCSQQLAIAVDAAHQPRAEHRANHPAPLRDVLAVQPAASPTESGDSHILKALADQE